MCCDILMFLSNESEFKLRCAIARFGCWLDLEVVIELSDEVIDPLIEVSSRSLMCCSAFASTRNTEINGSWVIRVVAPHGVSLDTVIGEVVSGVISLQHLNHEQFAVPVDVGDRLVRVSYVDT